MVVKRSLSDQQSSENSGTSLMPVTGQFDECFCKSYIVTINCVSLILILFIAQKWSKGKQKEKVNNMVLFDQGTYDKLLSEAPKFKLITPSILSDRLRVWLAQSHLACIFTCYKCMSFDCEIWTMFLNFCLKFVCLALLYPSNPSLKMEWKRNGGG